MSQHSSQVYEPKSLSSARFHTFNNLNINNFASRNQNNDDLIQEITETPESRMCSVRQVSGPPITQSFFQEIRVQNNLSLDRKIDP